MTSDRLKKLDAHFRAANYLSVGQIYLKDNPLLLEPLKLEHIKSRLLGHFGTSPGLNFIYSHLNRLIQDTNEKIIYFTGPGHGGPALRANVFLEGTMTKFYSDLSWSFEGVLKFMREFSWPGGVPSHVSPPTPGSIHEGGELGYSLAHAYGAVLDNPDLIAACVVGDGESETGPLAASWHSNKFINPHKDGIVLPILHLNGYKISGPTVFGRKKDEDIQKFFEGCGYQVRFVEGSDVEKTHTIMWEALDWAHQEIQKIRSYNEENFDQIAYPMIVMRTPKGWTGPKYVDGKKVEGSFRSHQVPISEFKEHKDHLKILEEWLKSYKPEELFSKEGVPSDSVLANIPKEEFKMGATKFANGGLLLQELQIPDFSEYEIKLQGPGQTVAESTRQVGLLVRDVMKNNEKNFRIFCPDETNSNRLNHVFDITNRMYIGKLQEGDDHLSSSGRVMEVLSEHLCQGWLEGYLLTGRHGLFPCYEAFALIVDSMLNQHGKWLKACLEIAWRKPIASLNYLLTSHAWRQDHNGYSHQGPGFIESVMQKKSSVARIYLPPDGNCLLSVMDHCLRSKNYVNLMICGKQPMPQWLTIEEAKTHCSKGIGIWDFASDNEDVDIVFATAGDTPTLEALAAVDLLKTHFSEIKIRFINVVDLFKLMHCNDHPHGIDQSMFYELFTEDKHVVFAFHGHPRVIHELIFHHLPEQRFHVHGYLEEGTTTTPFDMVVCNKASRYHLALNAIRFIPKLKSVSKEFCDMCHEKLEAHKKYIFEHGHDMPEVVNWKWPHG